MPKPKPQARLLRLERYVRELTICQFRQIRELLIMNDAIRKLLYAKGVCSEVELAAEVLRVSRLRRYQKMAEAVGDVDPVFSTEDILRNFQGPPQ
jgi:hypothetical protein